MNFKKYLCALSLLVCCSVAVFSQGVMTISDLVYAKTPEGDLQLDLYLPDNNRKDVLVIWIHGGAWRSGSKEDPPKLLLKHGYPMASINYRLSTEAAFPAQIHDIKAAIKFLRSKSKGFKFNADKIVLWGSSAGGHLAALAGLSNEDEYLEGTIGQLSVESSSVKGIIDFYGPANLTTILKQSTPLGLDVRIPALDLLLGRHDDEAMQKKASPVFYIDENDPPVFIAHGEQDPQVPINQSVELYTRCIRSGVNADIHFVEGNGHGGYGFENHIMEKLLLDWMAQF